MRDVYFDFCERGGLRPASEAPHVLAEVLGRDSRRRPADVLCIPALALSRLLPDGSRAVRTEPVCFDFAVINALGQKHHAETASGPGRAAEAYDRRKRARQNTEQACLQAGFRFWPVVHEVQGATSKAADAAVRAIAGAVAAKEGREQAAVKKELLERVALVITRSSARAIRKRSAFRLRQQSILSAAVARSQRDSVAGDGDE